MGIWRRIVFCGKGRGVVLFEISERRRVFDEIIDEL